MQCNIDARGKKVRFIGGAALLAVGLGVMGWAIPAGVTWAWLGGVVIVLAGAFMLFEARAGWCVVRAMGFRTRI